MTRHLLSLALLLLPLMGQAQIDPAAIEAAKAAGARAAGAPTSMVIDADGNPVLDAEGKPQYIQGSASAFSGNLRMFKGITGIEGVTSSATPGRGGAGMASVAMNQSVTFSCQTGQGQAYPAGGLSFRVVSCATTGTGPVTVNSAVLQVCDKATKGNVCASAADYAAPFTVPVGQYIPYQGLNLGIGCNSAALCSLTVKGSYTLGGSDSSLKRDGTATSGGTAVADLSGTLQAGNYTDQLRDIGGTLSACAALNSSNPNEAKTCDGANTISVSGTTQNPTCAGTPTCLTESVSVYRFTRSCVRSFPLTERKTSWTFDKKLECTVTDFQTKENGGSGLPSTNSCLATDTEALAGMTLVGRTADSCELNDSSCLQKTHVEYWVDFSQKKDVVVSAEPSAVGGACDMRADSETRYTTCGEWFGRTALNTECSVAYIDEATGQASGGSLDLDYQSKPGCGVCVAPTLGETCYATAAPSAVELANGADEPDSCANMDLAGCSFQSATAKGFSSDGGLVTEQEETYACMRETKQCTKWSNTGTDPSCISQDLAMGLDSTTRSLDSTDGSFAEAAVALAVVDATAGGLESGSDSLPKIFGGRDLRCNRPVGGIGSLVNKSCCSTDLQRPKPGNIFQKGCSMSEVELAASRRSNYTVYLGDYCSRSIKFFGFRKCIRRTQTYCAFEGLLPRLVHEQGRKQLRDITASAANSDVKKAPISFSYFDQGRGSWAPLQSVNGVQVTAWQWPNYCADPAKANEVLTTDPTATECPGVVTSYMASCDISTGCGPLPADPAEGSLNWSLVSVDPLRNQTSALGRFSVASGACSPSTNACSYEVAAWPVGTGGRAIVTKDLSWDLFASSATPGAGAPSAAQYKLSNIGDLMFRGYPAAGAAAAGLPSTVRLDLSRDGGQTWTTHQLNTQDGSEARLAPDVTISGGCTQDANICVYRVVGTTTVESKGWGGPTRPDCSGFTAGQLAVLDFSKMDLSEWLATVMSKIGSQDPAALASQATAQFQEFSRLYQGGQVRSAAPTAANFARATPAEGFGPFNVKLAVAGYWPEVTGDPLLDTDKVLSVTVNWGDCSADETLDAAPAGEGIGFKGTHEYLAPDARNPTTGTSQHSCLVKPGESLGRNFEHKVKLTVRTLKSGVQTRTLSVENAWARFPGANSNNDNVGQSTTVTVPAATR